MSELPSKRSETLARDWHEIQLIGETETLDTILAETEIPESDVNIIKVNNVNVGIVRIRRDNIDNITNFLKQLTKHLGPKIKVEYLREKDKTERKTTEKLKKIATEFAQILRRVLDE